MVLVEYLLVAGQPLCSATSDIPVLFDYWVVEKVFNASYVLTASVDIVASSVIFAPPALRVNVVGGRSGVVEEFIHFESLVVAATCISIHQTLS